MTRSGAEISPVKSSEELDTAWREFDFNPPGGDKTRPVWLQTVEKDSHAYLIARLAAVAVGFVVIKWDGPVSFEPEFTKVLAAEFPDQLPIPTIYLLEVHQHHRRKGIGTELTAAAEQHIIERPGAVPRVALNVKINNDHALRIYRSAGYQAVKYEDKETFELNYTNPDGKGGWVYTKEEVFIMTKDLSELRTD